jgi:hypothetical protein
MEDDLFEVFRDEHPRPHLAWVGNANSIEAARELIRSTAIGAREKFIVYNAITRTALYLRAEDCFLMTEA